MRRSPSWWVAARGLLAAQIASHPLLLDELLDEMPEQPARVGSSRSEPRLAHLAEDEPGGRWICCGSSSERRSSRAKEDLRRSADARQRLPHGHRRIIVEQAKRVAWTR
jgi:hypothetical protein